MTRRWKILALLAPAAVILAACSDDSVRVGPVEKPPVTLCGGLEDYMHTTALVPTPGPAFGIAGVGDIAVAAGEGGLTVIDIGQPASHQLRSVLDTTGVASDVDISGTLAVAAYGQTGIVVVDLTRPDAPVILSALSTPGDAIGVSLAGRLAYVADDQLGLLIVDIGNPRAPVYRGIENTPGQATGVVTAGSLALVSDAQLGVRVVNVTQPDVPWLVTAVPTPGIALDVATDNGYAFVADAQSGVQVVDVRSPAASAIVATVAVSARASAVAAANGRVYVADGSNGVTVYDASDPRNLRMLSRSSSASVSNGMRVTAGRLYIAETAGDARIVEIKNAVSPPLESIVIAPGANEVVAVASDSNLVHVVTEDQVSGGIFTVVDAGDGRVVGQTTFNGRPARSIAVADGFAYIATRDNAVVIVDVSNPVAPRFFDTVGIRDVNDVAVADSVLFMTNSPSGLAVLPLGVSQLPGGVSTGATGAQAVAVDGSYAYVSTLAGKLYTVNLNRLEVSDIATVGTFAYGVTVQRIPDPAFPEFLYDLLVYACVSTADGPGVRILDAENRASPVPIRLVRTAGAALDAVLDANTMYVATGDDDIEVFDMADFFNPRPMGTIVPPDGVAYGVALTVDTFAAAGGPSGLLLAPRDLCP